MTVKLLCDWKDSRNGREYKAGNLLTTDTGTESGLVAANMASVDLSGASPWLATYSIADHQALINTPSGPSKIVKMFGLPEENAGVRNYTLRTTIIRKRPFYAVRFRFNHPTSTAIVNVLANFTTSNSCASPNNPGNPNWKTITWSGASAFNPTPGVGGVMGVTVSDIFPVTPQQRVDGPGYAFEVGAYFPTAGNTVGVRVAGAGDASTIGQTADTYGLQCGASVGDCVTTPGSFVRSVVGLGACIEVEFFEADSGLNEPVLLVCGDSITQGQDSGRTHFGAAHIAANAAGHSLYNAGMAGRTRNVYLAFGLDRLPVVSPTYAFLAPWSPNDADYVTAGVADAVLGNATQWVSACDAVGAIPILATPTPKNGLTAPQESVRRGVVQAVKDFCIAAGVLMIDRDSVYADYSTLTGGFKSGLSADGLHPSATGYASESLLWLEAFKK